MTTISGSSAILDARILALRKMLELETKGITRRGKSAYLLVKEEFGFKGNRQKVLEQLNLWIKENMSENL